MSSFLNSAIASRILELSKAGVDVKSTLANDIENYVGSSLDLKLRSNAIKLTQVLTILKANNNSSEIDTCIKALEGIIDTIEE